MKSLIALVSWMFPNTAAGQVSAETLYYSEAVDIVDLERRMRQVSRGEAPFQHRYGNYEFR